MHRNDFPAEEHRARQGPPFADAPALADAIDAELVEPADETGPERCPEWREGEMRYPAEGDDLPNGDMPPGSSGLMTFEDAADVSAVANSAPSICPRRHPGDRGVSRANRARTGAVPAMPEIAVLQSICAYRLIVSPSGGSGSPVLKIRTVSVRVRLAAQSKSSRQDAFPSWPVECFDASWWLLTAA